MVDKKNKKGLGRGLMSLFGDQEVSAPQTDLKTDYLSVSISNLVANKFQPRTYFDKGKIEELAQSIKQNGLIQPIIVRPYSEEGVYEIIAGERRCMAAQNAGLHEVPVVVLKINDVQALELAIVENIQREDTGARITATLLNNLATHDKTFGVETMCVGGGQGMAMVVERLS